MCIRCWLVVYSLLVGCVLVVGWSCIGYWLVVCKCFYIIILVSTNELPCRVRQGQERERESRK